MLPALPVLLPLGIENAEDHERRADDLQQARHRSHPGQDGQCNDRHEIEIHGGDDDAGLADTVIPEQDTKDDRGEGQPGKQDQVPGIGRHGRRDLRPAGAARRQVAAQQHRDTAADRAGGNAQLRPAAQPMLRHDGIPGPAAGGDEDQDLAATDDEDRAAGPRFGEIDRRQGAAQHRQDDRRHHASIDRLAKGDIGDDRGNDRIGGGEDGRHHRIGIGDAHRVERREKTDADGSQEDRPPPGDPRNTTLAPFLPPQQQQQPHQHQLLVLHQEGCSC